jgi:hypothetical protein
LADSFRFQSMAGWLHDNGPVVRLNVMAARVCDKGDCSLHGGQEAVRETQGLDRPFKGHPQ